VYNNPFLKDMFMKNYSYITIIYLLLLAFTACQKEQGFEFKGDSRVQFGPVQTQQYSGNAIFADTLKQQTFVYSNPDVLIDTVYFDVYTMGHPSNIDRPFKLAQIQVPGVINAIPGTHYQAFDHSGSSGLYVIQRGKAHSRVPIILFRHESLKEQTVTLKFQLVDNEHFNVGQSNLIWRKLTFSDQIVRPAAWSGFNESQYLGTYSQEKHRFMISATGQRWDQEFLTSIIPDTEQLHYWLGQVKSALAAFNQANGGPRLDEFNQPIVFP
jgi:hypothetical protein